ncbi:copper transporter [Nocardia sp. alder85J]|uniref:copper transporter n=1 Tax=Nocardia sp. alder85J TaxID=2862949 RepID=UPI001CD70AF6|nr:copper transporter [Nocardia sp. alder85J]MCX4098298.1 copper transporter [Nocardia sp. alder85J]
MISFRQHAVSIAAIFLALAVGLVLGAQALSGGLLSSLRSDHAQLQQRADGLAETNGRLADQLNASDAFLARSGGRILGGVLTDRSVLMFTTPDADTGDVDAVTRALTAAGAVITGKIALTDSFIDSGQGDRLRTAVTNMIPAGAQLSTAAVDQGSLAGDLLGVALLTDPAGGAQRSTPQERTLILDTLRGGGFLTAGEVQPAQAAVLVTGEGARAAENNQGSIVARFAGGLRGRAAGVVLAGRPGAAAEPGPIAVVRTDAQLAATVSTVDDTDREIGRLTTALALGEQLAGGTGRYGVGPKATAFTVAAVPH